MNNDYIDISILDVKPGDEWQSASGNWFPVTDHDCGNRDQWLQTRKFRRHRLTHEMHELRKFVEGRIAHMETKCKLLEDLFLEAMDPHRTLVGSFTISAPRLFCGHCGSERVGTLYHNSGEICGCFCYDCRRASTIELEPGAPKGDTHMPTLELESGKTYPLIATFNGLDASGAPVTGLADPGGTYILSGGDSTVQQDAEGNWTITGGAKGGAGTVNFTGAFDGFSASGNAAVAVAEGTVGLPVSGSFDLSVGPTQ